MPTPQEIADARTQAKAFRDKFGPYGWAWLNTLLAATEPVSPPPANGSAWCQMCEKIGLYSEHQCFFGPVKP